MVGATRTGFEQHFVVKNKAAVAQVSSLNLPVRSLGLTVSNTPEGGLTAIDRAGKTVAKSAAPVMWDATVAPNSAEHLRQKVVGLKAVWAILDRAGIDPAPKPADQQHRFNTSVNPATQQHRSNSAAARLLRHR
ncbi:hypothetical protein ACNTMW_25070 [Planosporangium sp. 12N6]|uniref:hypothetical protein n=1 Tax=Planosporangium spinosum TaxID=3402278 RepID=UPI003CF6FB98